MTSLLAVNLTWEMRSESMKFPCSARRGGSDLLDDPKVMSPNRLASGSFSMTLVQLGDELPVSADDADDVESSGATTDGPEKIGTERR